MRMKTKLMIKMKNFSIIVLVFFAGLTTFAQEKIWTLRECVDYALENNITVKQNEIDVKLQEESIELARGNFLPNLNARASQNWNFGSFIGQSGSRISSDSRSNSFGLNSSITLFNGFANKSILAQSKIDLESQSLFLEQMKNDISLNVVNAYLQILFAKEQIKVNQAQLDLNKKELERLNELVEAGTTPRGDLLDIESNVATSEQNLVNAENVLTTSRLNLSQLLQLETIDIDIEDIDADINSSTILLQSSNTILEKALSFLPQLKKAELDIDSAEKNIDIAKAGFYPTVSLSYGLNTNYQHLQGTEDVLVINNPSGSSLIENGFFTQLENNLNHAVGFSVGIPIFNRFQNKVAVNRAKLNHDRIKYNLDSQKIQLRTTIQNAYVDAENALKTYEASLKTVEARRLAFEYAQERYNIGNMNAFDFSQSNNQLISAEAQLVRAKYDYAFKTKILEFYFGIPITE